MHRLACNGYIKIHRLACHIKGQADCKVPTTPRMAPIKVF